MTVGTRWERVNAAFHAAIEQPPSTRTALIRQLLGDEAEARDEVLRLLRAHDAAREAIRTTPFAELVRAFGDEEASSAVGLRVGAFRLVSLIARGGMGAVYLAERADGQFQQQVAVKLSAFILDPVLSAQFAKERQILARLEHPGIARLIDGGTTPEGIPYLVMEHVDGLSFEVGAGDAATTPRVLLRRLIDVCDAVAFAHGQLVVHGDIKPANVLVTRAGHVKLVDFGVAQVMTPETEGGQSVTTVALTPRYAAPEQRDGGRATPASDQYSLGVMVNELLEARTDLPRDVRLVAAKALRSDPQQRYASVAHLADDLRRVLDGRAVAAHPPSTLYRARRFASRNRLAVAATALLAATAVGAMIVTARAARAAEEARRVAERRFQEVRRLASTVLFDYHDQIRDLAGATPVRERLVRDSLAYLKGLAAESSADVGLQREVAAGYERISEIQGGTLFANLGDTSGAEASAATALALRRNIVDALGLAAQTDDHVALARVQQRLAVLYSDEGRVTDSLALLRDAATRLAPVAHRPDQPDARYQYGTLLNALAVQEHEAGQTDAARASLARARDLTASLPRPESETMRWRRLRSVLADSEGSVAISEGQFAAALTPVRQSIALREALVREFPANADLARSLGVAKYNEGEVLNHLGRSSEALESYRRLLAIVEPLAAADPRNEQYRGDIAYAKVREGDTLMTLGRTSDADASYRRALTLRSADVAADSRNVLKRAALTEVHAKLARVAASRRAFADAIQHTERAVALIDGAVLEDANAYLLSFVAETFMGLAAVAADTGRPGDGRRLTARALETWDRMERAGGLSDEDARKRKAAKLSLRQ